MVPRSTIYKWKRKFFALVSISSYLSPLSLIFHKMMPKFLKCSKNIRRSSEITSGLRRQGGKQRKRLGRKSGGRGLQRRRRRRRGC